MDLPVIEPMTQRPQFNFGNVYGRVTADFPVFILDVESKIVRRFIEQMEVAQCRSAARVSRGRPKNAASNSRFSLQAGGRLCYLLFCHQSRSSSHPALQCHKASDKLVDHPAVARSISIWIRSEVPHL